MSVFNAVTFESLDVESLFLLRGYILRGCGSSLYMKVIGSLGQRSKKCEIELAYGLSIGTNIGDLK